MHLRVVLPVLALPCALACGDDGFQTELPEVSKARFDNAVMQLQGSGCKSCSASDEEELGSEVTMPMSLLQTNLHLKSIDLVLSGYIPKGRHVSIGGIPSYVVGNATKAVVMIEDIPGIHRDTAFGSNMKQDADVLAEEGGYMVVLPDWLQRNPHPNGLSFSEYVKNITPAVVESVRNDVLPVLKTWGVKEWYAFGFCWGGAVALQTGGWVGPYAPKAVATTHPFLLFGADIEYIDVAQLKVPTLLMPSWNDTGAVGKLIASEQFQNNAFARNYTKIISFTDVYHGFCAGMVDWEEDPHSAKRCADALEDTLRFFAGSAAGQGVGWILMVSYVMHLLCFLFHA